MKRKKTIFRIRARPIKEPSEKNPKKRLEMAKKFLSILESRVFKYICQSDKIYEYMDVRAIFEKSGHYISIIAETPGEHWFVNWLFKFSFIHHWPTMNYKEGEQTITQFVGLLKANKAARKAKRKAKRRPKRPKKRQQTAEEAFYSKMFA